MLLVSSRFSDMKIDNLVQNSIFHCRAEGKISSFEIHIYRNVIDYLKLFFKFKGNPTILYNDCTFQSVTSNTCGYFAITF